MSSMNLLKSLTRNRTKGLPQPGLCHANHLRNPTCRDVHVSLIKSMEYCTVVVSRMLTLEILTDAFSLF